MARVPAAGAPLTAGYIRVSSTKQRDQSDSPASQRQRLKDAGATLFFQDTVSGFRLDQRKKAKGYRDLCDAITAGRVGRVLCTRLDRAGRRDSIVMELAELCEKAGAEFLTLAGGAVETGTASGWLSVKMQLVISEHFSRQLSENIRSGYQGLIAAGIPARSAASLPVQLQRIPGSRHGVEESPAWPHCRHALDQLLAGRWNMAEAGRYLFEHTGRLGTSRTVAAWMRGRHLTGHMATRSGEILIRDCWPAIASESEYQQIQSRIRSRARGANITAPIRALSGLVKCIHCTNRRTGSNVVLSYSAAKRSSGTYLYLRCNDPACPSRRAHLRADRLEEALFLQWVSDHLQLLAEAHLRASTITVPSPALLPLQQELRAREQLPAQFRSAADQQRIRELQDQIRRESTAPAELDPAVLALFDQSLRVVPLDSGWPSPTFHGQIDAPPGTPWGWFHDRPEEQRNADLRRLLDHVLVDPVGKDPKLWIKAVKWHHNVVDEDGNPIGISGVSDEADQLARNAGP